METIENTTGLQSAPAGQVTNLSKKKLKKKLSNHYTKLKLCSNSNKFQ